MCKFISEYFQRHAKEKKICEEIYRTYSSRINYLVVSEQSLFADTLEKVDVQTNARWTENAATLIEGMKSDILPQMRKARNYKELKESYILLEEIFRLHPMRVCEHDQLAHEVNACKAMLSQLDALEARYQQQFSEETALITTEQKNDWMEQLSSMQGRLNAFVGCQTVQNQLYITLRNRIDLQYRELPGRITQHNMLCTEVENCKSMILQLDALEQECEYQFSQMTVFIMPEQGNAWLEKLLCLEQRLNHFTSNKISQNQFYNTLRNRTKRHQRELPERINRHNENVYQTVIGKVEGRDLDKQQLNCIVKPAHNHLVLAGAGTGKTTTVVGKVKYLLRSGAYKPENILVLSFTNASATEMDQRIQAETGANIAASTFHKLGLNIITKVDGVKPRISKLDMRSFVKEQMERLICSGAYLGRLSMYLLNSRVETKSEFSFHSKDEYDKYLKENPPVTLKKETVKSYGEMEIANFLTLNNIAYIYEYPYELDTRTQEYGQYYPDFYLPDYKIYIEYFGINRQGNVPDYFTGKNGKSGTQTYRESMEWKRKLHQDNETKMVECFAYENFEGTLTDNLEKKLIEYGVQLKPMPPEEIWKQVAGEDSNKILDGIVDLIGTVINLLKSNEETLGDLKAKADAAQLSKATYDLIYLIEPIYNAYMQQLNQNQEIDFNDMINLAAGYVRQGKYRNTYSYVIVDEYQDISSARYRLLKALRDSHDYDLFCVGDDWQSIYRFAGSDIGFVFNFEKYWGKAEESKIETTYRFTQSLIDISGNFVMMNPKQKQKRIRGVDTDSRFALSEVNGYTEKYAAEFLTQKLEDLPKDSSVFLLGRYHFDRDILKNCDLFDLQYSNQTQRPAVRYSKRPDLKMEFLTVHQSKGLQADYVVILNNKSTRMGFPSRIQDSAILSLLLDNSDDYPHGEERRLFYVALTRAKKKAILLTIKDKESCFIQELRERYGEQLQREQFECPLCGGRLVRRSGKYGEFFGCSNYKTGQCKYTRNIRWKTDN